MKELKYNRLYLTAMKMTSDIDIQPEVVLGQNITLLNVLFRAKSLI